MSYWDPHGGPCPECGSYQPHDPADCYDPDMDDANSDAINGGGMK